MPDDDGEDRGESSELDNGPHHGDRRVARIAARCGDIDQHGDPGEHDHHDDECRADPDDRITGVVHAPILSAVAVERRYHRQR